MLNNEIRPMWMDVFTVSYKVETDIFSDDFEDGDTIECFEKGYKETCDLNEAVGLMFEYYKELRQKYPEVKGTFSFEKCKPLIYFRSGGLAIYISLDTSNPNIRYVDLSDYEEVIEKYVCEIK